MAAFGALVDQANGGRMHPEQWLGAAAVVCGLGLLVGTVRGHARWLVVPAAAFTAAGALAAPVARLGIDLDDLAGDRDVFIGEGTSGGRRAEHVGFGTIDIDVGGVPDGPVAVDARVAIGDVRVDVNVASDVTVEVRSRIDDGELRRDGSVAGANVVRIGPAGEPDVVVNARVGRGDVVVGQYRVTEDRVPDVPIITPRGTPARGRATDAGGGPRRGHRRRLVRAR